MDRAKQTAGLDERIAGAVGLALLVACLLVIGRFDQAWPLALGMLVASLGCLGYALARGIRRKRSLTIFLDDLGWGGSILISIPLFLASAFVTGILVSISGLPIEGPGSTTTKTIGTIISFAFVSAIWIGISQAADNARDRIYKKIQPINPTGRTDFGPAIADGLTLVDFWAPWCSPCHEQAAILHDYKNPEVKIISVNVDKEEALATNLFVQSLPTLILFADGHPVERTVGVTSHEQIDRLLENHHRKINPS